MPMSTSAAHPFDSLARSYDESFTYRLLGRWLREGVWQRLEAAFTPGDTLLELGCGTGEDAIWLARRGVGVLATDASQAMLDVARRKAQAVGIESGIAFVRLDLADIRDDFRFPVPDFQWLKDAGPAGEQERETSSRAFLLSGAFSNFGALNCLPDRRPLAQALAQIIRPGGRVVLVLMGPICAWEIFWHLLHGEARTALRRLRSGAEAHIGTGATVPVWYPSPRRLRAEFAPFFAHRETAAIGALLPPSHLAHLVERWPRSFARLMLLERRLRGLSALAWLADHYVMVFERQ